MRNFKPLALTLALSNIFIAPVYADEVALQKKIDQLASQLAKLQHEIKNLHSQTEAIATQQETISTTSKDHDTGSSESTGATLWGYGEINYNHPTGSAPVGNLQQDNTARMDLRRAIFGIGYKFDDSTRFISEFEVEHAIVSAGDSGEVAMEQFYIDHKLSKNLHLKAGLFLIPTGLLNVNHEPTQYYGVERNFVETAIIPSTWREGGLAVYGSTDQGLAWEVGVTTTVDLSSWDASSSKPQKKPLGSIHQELQKAKANNLGYYGSLNYRGIPGLVVGGSMFTSKISQNQPNTVLADSSRMLLWDTHVRWTPANWDFSAVYAKGTISNTQAMNLTFVGMPSPIPKEFFGWYVQSAYKVWQNNGQSLAPFVRYEHFNTGAKYAAMPQGFEIPSLTTEKVSTIGLSYYLNPNVVFKMDYQSFAENSSLNRMDLGFGLTF